MVCKVCGMRPPPHHTTLRHSWQYISLLRGIAKEWGTTFGWWAEVRQRFWRFFVFLTAFWTRYLSIILKVLFNIYLFFWPLLSGCKEVGYARYASLTLGMPTMQSLTLVCFGSGIKMWLQKHRYFTTNLTWYAKYAVCDPPPQTTHTQNPTYYQGQT